MTSLPVSYTVVGHDSTNLKSKYGVVTELTQDLWTHIIIRKNFHFKTFNVLELSKLLKAFINKINLILPEEQYHMLITL